MSSKYHNLVKNALQASLHHILSRTRILSSPDWFCSTLSKPLSTPRVEGEAGLDSVAAAADREADVGVEGATGAEPAAVEPGEPGAPWKCIERTAKMEERRD